MSSYRRFSVSGGTSNPYGGGRKYGGGPVIGGGTSYNPRVGSGTSYGTSSYGTSRDVGSGYTSSAGGSGYGSLGRSYGYSSLPASDAGSTRSLSSGRSYGSDRPTYGRQYSDSGGGTSGHYSNFDSGSTYRSKPLDRSLSYASLNVGSVSNIRDRFDRPTTSRDRYSSVERQISSRDGDHGGRASGYMSDVGSSRSYGSYDRSSRAPSVSRSTYGSYSRETSPVRSSSRSSSRYGGGGYDFGASYSSRPKSSADIGTPYTRTKSSDYNLTPFTRTRTSSISDRNYERQPSVDRSSRASVDRSTRASVDRHIPTYTRQSSRDYSTSSKPPISSRRSQQVESEESSESVSESEEKLDANYRYLVSRGTDPMDTEKERERESRRSYSSRKKKKVPTATLR